MEKIYPIAVIGGGSAGTMAVLRSVLNNDETLFFPGSAKDRKRSRGFWVSKVENVPGHLSYQKGIEEPAQETFKWLTKSKFKEKFHWNKNRGIQSISQRKDGVFVLKDSKDNQYLVEYIILCTGVMDVQPLIHNEIGPIFPYANAQSVDYCLRCDGHHTLGKKTVVIGDSEGSAWVAIMLKERYENPAMTVITHGKKQPYSREVQDLIDLYGINVIEDEIIEILGDKKLGELQGFSLRNSDKVEAEIAFVGLGMMVYNELAIGLGAEVDSRGFVITSESGMSSIKNLYIAGDLRAGAKKQIYTAWDHAVDAADEINRKIRAKKRTQRFEQS